MKKILISEKGRKFLVKGAEFHSNHGRVDIEEGEESVESHLGHRFAVLDPDLIDIYEKRSEERRVGKECRSRWSPYH